ncbi:MAG: 8-oxoguanine deaminase [Chloroflexi bacterium]|nr:8-oxoguanine deaminase [Chloroflexota bacterium]HOA22517.1 8-oxoguanine deaminase [Aggregatilineales bacterium]
MGTVLVRHAHTLVTMDRDRREISDGGVFIRDNVIEQVGPTSELPSEADEIIDLSGHIVMPGLVNTHHHMYQTLTRAMAQDSNLFNWLKTLYPIWAGLTSEAVYISALTAMAELILSGCTTSSDHLYIYPNDARIDDEIRAAQEIGMRFHAARGSMSLGESQGGLPPDSVVEKEEDILRDSQRAIETYHDPSRHSMLRIVLAPCSPFSVTPDLMRESVKMAQEYDVLLHTHLAETLDEEQFCLETFGRRPVEYMQDLGWMGDHVWHAHSVFVNDEEVKLFAETDTGVAHCPNSNMRLGSGVAPILAYRAHGVRVGLGVDGSASNDGGHMLGEARQAMLLQRVQHGPEVFSARQALEMATLGGASVLRRDDIGALAPGMSADLIAIDLNRVEYAGALHDPVAATVLCAPLGVDFSMINGRVVVKEGQLTTIDLGPVIERHNQISRALINKEPIPQSK